VERSGSGVEGRSAAEVCTSAARKIGCLLSRARDGVPQEAGVFLRIQAFNLSNEVADDLTY
jgi:hypothetical protein